MQTSVQHHHYHSYYALLVRTVYELFQVIYLALSKHVQARTRTGTTCGGLVRSRDYTTTRQKIYLVLQ